MWTVPFVFGSHPFFEFARRQRFSDASLHIFENSENISVKVMAPGVKPNDFDITMEGNTLIVKGSKKENTVEENWQQKRSERFTGEVLKRIELAESVDPNSVRALYNDGILTIEVAKKAESKPIKIEVE